MLLTILEIQVLLAIGLLICFVSFPYLHNTIYVFIFFLGIICIVIALVMRWIK